MAKLSQISRDLLQEVEITDEIYYKYAKRICNYTYNILRYSLEKEDAISECCCDLFKIKRNQKLDFSNPGFVKYMITTARNSIIGSFIAWMKWENSKNLR